MNGEMKKYRESLDRMSEPIMPSQMKNTMELRGLMQYARIRVSRSHSSPKANDFSIAT